MTGYRLACDFLHVADMYVYSWQCSLSDSNSHTQQIDHDSVFAYWFILQIAASGTGLHFLFVYVMFHSAKLSKAPQEDFTHMESY